MQPLTPAATKVRHHVTTSARPPSPALRREEFAIVAGFRQVRGLRSMKAVKDKR